MARAIYNDPKYIVEIAKQYPDLQIVICHLFWPRVDYCVGLTASLGNIHYDTSGLADESVLAATGRGTMEAALKRLVVQGKKIIFGTDYAGCSVSAHIGFINGLRFTEDKKRGIIAENAKVIYGII